MYDFAIKSLVKKEHGLGLRYSQFYLESCTFFMHNESQHEIWVSN